MYNKPKLIMMVGLPASGKSTFAKYLSNYYKINMFSSDEIRKELCGDESDQTKNAEVFNILKGRVRTNLQLGNGTIIDATNVSIKSRRNIIQDYCKDIDCEKIAYIMATPIDNCIKNNQSRERKVPEDVIYQMYKAFQIPFYEEGFDKIHIICNKDIPFVKISDIQNKMKGVLQHNPHHIYDLYTHSRNVAVELHKIQGSSIKHTSYVAGCIHDFGKMYTQTFDSNGVAHYYQHHCVGAYKLLSEYALTKTLPDTWLEILFLVNYHMLPFQWQKEKTHKKYKKIFGEEKYNLLIDFNKADKLASGTDREGV